LKDLFPAFYQDNGEPASFLDEAVFSFDTNALLGIYKFNKKARGEWLDGLAYLKSNNRLFIPYQVAYEYHRHVKSEMIKSGNVAPSSWRLPVKSLEEKLIELLADENNALHGDSKINELCEPFLKEVSKFSKDLNKALQDWQKIYHVDAKNCFDKIANLLKDHVGQKPSAKEVQEFCRLAQARFSQNIPPGYEDKNKLPPGNPYGDAIIWFQMIQFAKERQLPLVFVTYEKKEDWIRKKEDHDEPRIELRNEMLQEAGVHFDILNPKGFSKMIVGKLEISDPASIAESERVMHDELYNDPTLIMLAMAGTGVSVRELWCTHGFMERLKSYGHDALEALMQRRHILSDSIDNEEGMVVLRSAETRYLIRYCAIKFKLILTDIQKQATYNYLGEEWIDKPLS